MKIIVCGAGQVGWQIARHLSGERNDVTIVDSNADLVRRATEILDVQGLAGFASYPDVLDKAGARDADMIIAATYSDEVNMVACLINPLVREMVDQFRVIMKEGQLEIISTVESSVEVMLDVDAFRQMFLNILDNAVKFSPMGEKIEVKLLDDRNGINLSIEDRGPGVPMRSRERIWDPYYRVHTDAKSAVGGTGIGLAIVRELARLQNLYVSMAQREGGGSKFMITINKKKLS